MQKIFISMGAICLSFSAISQQVQGTYLGSVKSYGAGCPSGTVSVTLSPDSRSMALFFNPDHQGRPTAEVSAGRSYQRYYQVRSCIMSIPFKFPKGYAFDVVSLDFRGYTFATTGSYTRLRSVARWSGRDTLRSPASIRDRIFKGEIDEDFVMTQKLGLAKFSLCREGEAKLDLNIYMAAVSDRNRDDVVLSLDSIDSALQSAQSTTNFANVAIQWQRCP